MCCGNCSVWENLLAKFEGYPAIIGIINMKLTSRLYILSAVLMTDILYMNTFSLLITDACRQVK